LALTDRSCPAVFNKGKEAALKKPHVLYFECWLVACTHQGIKHYNTYHISERYARSRSTLKLVTRTLLVLSSSPAACCWPRCIPSTSLLLSWWRLWAASCLGRRVEWFR
jgi:hypothetical protein